MNKIVIWQGDEFRAKLESGIEQGTFFEEINRKAMKIVDELVRDDDCGQSKDECPDTEKHPLHRRGNNIIVFSGARGQGKTSALQSFAKQLGNKNTYYVLKPIDPSSLEEDESVVRILISVLYNNVTLAVKHYIKEEKDENNEEKLRRDRDEMMKMFQECFKNVDYSVKNNKNDYGMDDLELLSQLGSSTILREKLQKLIWRFLKFQSNYYGKESDYNTLVIQIDDADLALSGVLKICEDIRNYFALHNVIVLMAADMEQFTNSLLQEYISKNRDLIALDKKATSAVNSEEDYHLNSCIKMANRYMEKMFPVTHRIELPNIQGLSKYNFKNINLQYVKDNGKDKGKEDFFNEFNGAIYDMQKQLLQKLYQRTGIIFFDTESKIHPFLPKTMRELTHFVKLLYTMPVIDFEKAYIVDSEDNSNLRDNLNMIEEYFFDHWCANNLKEDKQIELRKLRQKLFDADQDIVNDFVNKANFDIVSYDISHIIVYSIYLNKKFANDPVSGELAYYFMPFVSLWTAAAELTGFKILNYEIYKKSPTLDNFIFCTDVDEGYSTFSLGNAVTRFMLMPKEYKTDMDDGMRAYKDTSFLEFIAVRNIFANLEVYLYVTGRIYDTCTQIMKDISIDFRAVSNVYAQIFECLNLPTNEMPYCNMGKEAKDDTIDIALGKYLQTAYENDELTYVESFWNVRSNRTESKKIRDPLKADLGELAASIGENLYEQLAALPQQLPDKDRLNLTVSYPGEISTFRVQVLNCDPIFFRNPEINKLYHNVGSLFRKMTEYNERIDNVAENADAENKDDEDTKGEITDAEYKTMIGEMKAMSEELRHIRRKGSANKEE